MTMAGACCCQQAGPPVAVGARSESLQTAGTERKDKHDGTTRRRRPQAAGPPWWRVGRHLVAALFHRL